MGASLSVASRAKMDSVRLVVELRTGAETLEETLGDGWFCGQRARKKMLRSGEGSAGP